MSAVYARPLPEHAVAISNPVCIILYSLQVSLPLMVGP